MAPIDPSGLMAAFPELSLEVWCEPAGDLVSLEATTGAEIPQPVLKRPEAAPPPPPPPPRPVRAASPGTAASPIPLGFSPWKPCRFNGRGGNAFLGL